MANKFTLLCASCLIVLAVMAQVKQPAGTGKGNATRGKIIYAKECITCHQADGGGVPGLNPPLAESSWATGDKARIIHIVLNGMNDRVEIDGEYYSNSIASHKHLTNKQIADVLTYVRTSFGNNASAVSAAEVEAVRNPKKKKNEPF